MTFAQSTNGGIAGHFSNAIQSMGQECCAGSRSRGGGRSFSARVATSHNDDIVAIAHADYVREAAWKVKVLRCFT
jgi:hypothetical protein